VIHLPSQELLSVQTLDGREVLIPFVSEIVPAVDIKARRITITPPPGLLDD
jgi:16S rRNA processing protein RimM